MSGKQAKKMRREARGRQGFEMSNWTDEIPHPADENENVRVETLPVDKVPPAGVQLIEAMIEESKHGGKKASGNKGETQVFLTLKEVAARLMVSPRTVQRMEKAPDFPAPSRFARVVRYHWPSVEKWFLSRSKR